MLSFGGYANKYTNVTAHQSTKITDVRTVVVEKTDIYFKTQEQNKK